MTLENERIWDVAIVGAGLTGLVAAAECKNRGLSVLLLEAGDEVGGRVRTESQTFNKKESFFDLGARFIGRHPQQMHLTRLVETLKLETIRQYQGPETRAEDDGNYWGGLAAHLLREGSVSNTPDAYIGAVLPKDAAGRFYLKYLNGLIDDFPLHDPKCLETAEKFDSMSVQEWVDDVRLPEYGPPPSQFKALLRMLCRVGFSEEPENISMLWFLFYIASSGGLQRFQAIRWPVEGAQGYRLARGAHSLAEALSRVVGADSLRLSHPVKRVIDKGELVEVWTPTPTQEDPDKETSWLAKKVLIALSPALYADAKRLEFSPQLPPGRLAAASAMRMPPMVLSYVTFDNKFWRDDTTRYPQGLVNGEQVQNISRYGLSGDVLLAEGPVVWIMDATSSVEQPALFAFIVGASVAPLTSRKQREDAVLAQMAQVFGADAITANNPRYFEKHWSEDPLATGGPAAHFISGGHFFEHGREILLAGNSQPHGNVYFASTETAMISNGYMAGAVWSGQEVAEDIALTLGGRAPQPASSLAREQAMIWCIRQILRAIKEQDPTLEHPALHKDIVFYGPGGTTLPKGPYPKKDGTFVFYKLLAQKISLTNVNIESIAVDVENDTGFASFSVDGLILSNGNPFHGIKATMAFKFTGRQERDVLVEQDWLFLNCEAIDAMVAAPPGPFAEGTTGSSALAPLEARAKAIANLDYANAGDDPFLIYGPEASRLGGQLIGAEGLRQLADWRGRNARLEQLSGTLEPRTMTYCAWQVLEGRRLLVTVQFESSHEPRVAEVYFQLERD